jgi:hypothetical protein
MIPVGRIAPLLLLAATCVGRADAVPVSPSWGSPLALGFGFRASGPEGWLAERAIEREWPVRGDSGVVTIPGGRSELGALGLSAAFPGAGQLYAGESRGAYFAAAEVAGWLGWLLLRNNADGLRDDARTLAGAPDDSTSAFSFERLEDATEEDTSDLRALYAADRESFDQVIGSDARYAAGWSSPDARTRFDDLRQRSDRRLSQSRTTESVLWVNHLLAALDAFRIARLRNLSIAPGLQLKADGRLSHGRPAVRLALERRF